MEHAPGASTDFGRTTSDGGLGFGREICGDLAYYFDSFDPAAMAAVIRHGLQDHDAHPQRPAELRAHASQFSWTRAATEYWSLYDEVFRSPRR